MEVSDGRVVPVSGLQIRPPIGMEELACRQLLLERGRPGYWADFAIAVDGSPPRILGALAYTPGVHVSGIRGWQVRFRVARPYRRQGIGTSLLRYAIDAAIRCQVDVLQTTHDPIQEPDVDSFLTRRGFVPDDRLNTYQVDIGPVTEFMCSLRDWLIERGDVPDDYRIVSLRQVLLDDVARLHTQYIGGTHAAVMTNLKRIVAGPTADDNRILIVGDQIVGVILGETKDGLSRVDVTIVRSDFQGRSTQSGWVQAVQMASCLERARDLGSTRAQFSCLTRNRPMMRMVSRLHAVPIAVEQVHLLRLATDPLWYQTITSNP